MNKAFLATEEKHYKQLNLTDNIQLWEDGLRTSGKENSYEWWYFDAEFENKTKIVCIFYTKYKHDIDGPACPTAKLEVTLPSGEKIYNEITEGKGNLIRASKEKCHVKIKDSWIEYTEGVYKVHYVGNGITYDCVMTPKLPMWRPATGHLYFGDESKYLAWVVPQPSADIDAVLNYNGQDINLKGTGYHDHNWGNYQLLKLINHWYWCRCTIGDYTAIAVDIIAEKAYDHSQTKLILLAKDGKIISDDQEKLSVIRENVEMNETLRKKVTNRLTFKQEISPEETYTLEFNKTGDIGGFELLDNKNIPFLKRFMAKCLGIRPNYLRIVGDTKLTIEKDGEKEILTSEGIWEKMYFGKDI